MQGVTRRSFLKTGAAGIAAAAILPKQVFAADENPYAPFNMGMQSYSVRTWKTLDGALEKAKELGLKNLEFYPGHMAMSADAAKIAEYKKKLDDAGIKIMAYGVVGIAEDAKNGRAVFEWAKAMGIYCVSVDFPQKAGPALSKLCEEFPDVHLGIHNHGPKSRYQTPEDVIACVKDLHKNVGATADLGHFIRSEQEPLEVIEKLKDRLYGIHFKDFKVEGGKTLGEVIPGDAKLKVKETLALLKKIKFEGCISLEYESNPTDPLPDMKTALERVKAALKEI